MNFAPYESHLFYPEYQSVVGVASRMVEAVVAPRETAAAARTNPARRRRLTTAGRTGRVSCVRCKKEKTVTSLNPGLLPWPSHSYYNKSISSWNVRQFLCPAFLSPPSSLTLTDQYAFHHKGSTTAALISIFNSVSRLLACNIYMVVVALNFSKAFNSICHSTLLTKMAQRDLPDAVFNWFVDYFRGHEHCTKCNIETSSCKVQQSGIVCCQHSRFDKCVIQQSIGRVCRWHLSCHSGQQRRDTRRWARPCRAVGCSQTCDNHENTGHHSDEHVVCRWTCPSHYSRLCTVHSCTAFPPLPRPKRRHAAFT